MRALTPFTKTRTHSSLGLQPFADECSWATCPERYVGDLALLKLLRAHLDDLTPAMRFGRIQAHSADELAEDEVLEVVETIEQEHPGWALAGDTDQPIHERLDAHMLVVQEHGQTLADDHARQAREQAEASERETAEQAARDRQRDRELYGV